MYTPIERKLYWGVQFPKTPRFNKTIASAELHQSEASHDVLTLLFKGVLDKNKEGEIKKGDPVKFIWGTGPYKEVFIGFVELIEKNSAFDRNTIRIVCVNNSSVFKVPSKKVHKNSSSDKIVKTLASQYGFEADVDHHDFIHSNLPQAGHTHWQLLRHLSQKTGYVLRAENKKIIFKPRHKVVAEKLESAPLFYHFTTFPRGAVGMQTLLSFTALDSKESPVLNAGDVGVELHNKEGSKYSFNSGNGLPKYPQNNAAIPTTDGWGKVNES